MSVTIGAGKKDIEGRVLHVEQLFENIAQNVELLDTQISTLLRVTAPLRHASGKPECGMVVEPECVEEVFLGRVEKTNDKLFFLCNLLEKMIESFCV